MRGEGRGSMEGSRWAGDPLLSCLRQARKLDVSFGNNLPFFWPRRFSFWSVSEPLPVSKSSKLSVAVSLPAWPHSLNL